MRVHSVLYGNEQNRVEQSIAHLNRAADLAVAAGVFKSVSLAYGDSSPRACLDDEFLGAVRKAHPAITRIDHLFFDGNLGSAKGHNTLIVDAQVQETEWEALLIMNPDVMLAPDALIELARPLDDPHVGMVEARQLPIEHPKEYHKLTGETGWATTACALIPMNVIRELDGFDQETFFLYCDDVDFSWRARLAGYRIIYQPSAVVFHDKRLGANGQWAPTSSEQYYSAEAALLMAYKFSRKDIAERLLKSFAASDLPHLRKAANEFDRRMEEGRLPKQIDVKGAVAEFVGDYYTKHRYSL
ncbi:glycosyltransferase family 2 protein [Rhodanobacter sp. DHB23]|nr:glycosyltransferase family 2 protein [Rhodanobacter sp. DHB23]